MNPRDLLLALTVVTIWGVNFVVIEVGLEDFPPLLFTALRFFFAAVPAMFLLGRPRVAWRYVVGVGLALGVAKFGLVFFAMDRGVPAGLASLVLQCQVIFTVVFAIAVLRERPRPAQLAGIAIACAGMLVILLDRGLSAPVGAVALVILAGACWGVSNTITRSAKPQDTLRFMVWVSAVAVVPLLVLSLLTEGPQADLDALRGIDLTGVGALAFLAFVATLFGFGVWGYLLRQYDASTVAPFSLLVPVVGMAAAWLLRGEAVGVQQAIAAALIIGGMACTVIRPAAAASASPEPVTTRTPELHRQSTR
ncbi:EamA family transporter [Kribbella sandramycini]|uniref:EamA family transporter n=1 Tax=Kribbella sandramycini TaxID=60450 RepID=A0A7Y4NZE0_9ACTN|nr:EamA family transporter [Kribbella sandramycini]MBB6567318.1 O-acetylserine/cysteine efflux transporter [Kribbella sandramycini]NOL40070.1 EamA family transporter [Kribbella sandramycini]